VQVTERLDMSSVSVPCAVSVVFAGSQFAAEAAEAPNAIIIDTAATAVPNFFMPRMMSSFADAGHRRRE